MADYGGNLGIKVTIENHWGLAADPMNIRTILDEVNHPYCEASPDFGNWEHEYMLFNGLKAIAPYAHTHVHAKYWDRWATRTTCSVRVRIMLAAGSGARLRSSRERPAERHRRREVSLQGSDGGALESRAGDLRPTLTTDYTDEHRWKSSVSVLSVKSVV
jgi:hypothetical protein